MDVNVWLVTTSCNRLRFHQTDSSSLSSLQLNQVAEDPLKRPVVYVKGNDAVKLMNIVNKQKVARARIQHRPPRVRAPGEACTIKTRQRGFRCEDQREFQLWNRSLGLSSALLAAPEAEDFCTAQRQTISRLISSYQFIPKWKLWRFLWSFKSFLTLKHL